MMWSTWSLARDIRNLRLFAGCSGWDRREVVAPSATPTHRSTQPKSLNGTAAAYFYQRFRSSPTKQYIKFHKLIRQTKNISFLILQFSFYKYINWNKSKRPRLYLKMSKYNLNWKKDIIRLIIIVIWNDINNIIKTIHYLKHNNVWNKRFITVYTDHIVQCALFPNMSENRHADDGIDKRDQGQ